MNMVDLSSMYDDPLDPEENPFTTKLGTACRGCMFHRQRVSVCDKAVALALRAGMESCDCADVVYVPKDDPRQMTLLKDNT